MRLYLDLDSSKNITYTPDLLIIENNGVRYIYDINGDVDVGEGGLHCRVKGELAIVYDDDTRSLSEKEEKELLRLLDDDNSKFFISIYPFFTEDENDDKIEADDILKKTDGLMTIFINLDDKEIVKEGMHFGVEFYGI